MLQRLIKKPDLTTLLVVVALGVALAHFLYTLLPRNVFVHPDYYRYILQETTRDGLAIQWRDVINSFQIRSPGEFRPRFLAYGIQAIDQKLRLSLYEHMLVHPTIAPIAWFLQLIVGPFLLFFLIRSLTDRLLAALAAVAVYVSSIGFLSGFTMGLLQGKALSNVAYITVLYLVSRVKQRAAPGELLYEVRGIDKYLALCVLFIGLFLDELPLFAFILVPVTFLGLFIDLKRPWSQVRRVVLNGGFFGIPFLLFLLVVLLIVPIVTQKYFGFDFDYIGNALAIGEHKRGAHSIFSGPYADFSLAFVIKNLTTLFGLALAPWQLSPLIKSEYGDYFGSQLNNLPQIMILVTFFATAVLLAFRRDPPSSSALRGLLVAGPLFTLFLTLLLVRHIPIATGYYYGCSFAVIFAGLVGLCYSVASQVSRRIAALAGVVVIAIVMVQIDNFIPINRGWIRTHNEIMTRNDFSGQLSLGPPALTRRSDLEPIWQAWREGRMEEYLKATAIPAGAVYLVFELRAIRPCSARSGGRTEERTCDKATGQKFK